jgi:O-antigen/teichoic acid export membrane protein
LLVIGLKVPIDLMLVQPQAELARRKAYGRLAQRNLVTTFVASIISVALLAFGWPRIGWIAFTLGSSVAMLLGTVIGTGALRRPTWNPGCLRPLWPEAIRSSVVRFASAANGQLDQLFLGAMLGPVAFSFYNFGKRIEAAFINVIGTFCATLFQPYFANTLPEGRAEALRKSFVLLHATIGVATATFVAVGDLLIAALLGPTWSPAAPVAVIMAFGVQLRAFAAVIACLLSVTGRNATMLRYFLVTTMIGLAVVAATAHLGATAVAAALLLRMFLSLTYLVHAVRKDTGLQPVRLYMVFGCLPYFAKCCAAVAGRALVTGNVWEPGGTSLALTGAACTAAAAAAGSIGLGLLMRERRSIRLLLPPRVASAS